MMIINGENMVQYSPLVSVIIPCYNAEQFIHDTLKSVQNQTYINLECIVVDDGSKDNTVNLVKEFCKQDNRFIFVLGQHGGVSRARNLAISISKGDFIALLDHDDTWQPEKLEEQIKLFDKDPALGLVHSDAIIKEPGFPDLLASNKLKSPSGRVFIPLLRSDFLICQTVVIRKSYLRDRGTRPFEPELEMVEEYELFIWLSLRCAFGFVPKPLAIYKLHGNNDSVKRRYLFAKEMKIVRERLLDDPAFQAKYKVNDLSPLDYQIKKEESKLAWIEGRRTKALRILFRRFNPARDMSLLLRYFFFSPKGWERIRWFITFLLSKRKCLGKNK
jgi:glycosyltransferase involved in cell wall biosynthesis